MTVKELCERCSSREIECDGCPYTSQCESLAEYLKDQSPCRLEGIKKEHDPSRIHDERMKRFWHYMETKGMNEQWIETAEGELRIVIEALADYYDIASRNTETMETAWAKAAWGNRLERIKQIQTKLEESTGYSRDKQLEICMKRKPVKDNDIGEDAMVLMYRRGKAEAERKEKKEDGEKGETAKEN